VGAVLAGQLSANEANTREIERAWVRARVRIDLERTEPRRDEGELAAFDVVVAGLGHAGRWAQLGSDRGVVVWTDGTQAETDGLAGERVKVAAAVRRSVPVTSEMVDAFKQRQRSGGGEPPPLLR